MSWYESFGYRITLFFFSGIAVIAFVVRWFVSVLPPVELGTYSSRAFILSVLPMLPFNLLFILLIVLLCFYVWSYLRLS